MTEGCTFMRDATHSCVLFRRSRRLVTDCSSIRRTLFRAETRKQTAEEALGFVDGLKGLSGTKGPPILKKQYWLIHRATYDETVTKPTAKNPTSAPGA